MDIKWLVRCVFRDSSFERVYLEPSPGRVLVRLAEEFPNLGVAKMKSMLIKNMSVET